MKSLISSILSVFRDLKLRDNRNTFEGEVELIFDKYFLVETFKNRFQVVESMSKLGQKYPKEWLPNYCASYFYTLLIFSIPKEKSQNKITQETILKESQKNLDLAFNKIKECPPKVRSDFHALQSLIYDLKNRTSKDLDLKNQYIKKRAIEIKQAIQTDSNSPLVNVIVGKELIKKGDFNSVYAGEILLQKAKQKYYIDRYDYYNSLD